MSKQNCWEFKNCGREPGGLKSKEMGVCPAAIESKFDQINEGKCAGRACWVVAGTFCGGKIQGTFAHKLTSCMRCEFYKQVEKEHGREALLLKNILEKANKPGAK
jgi:hypothetical protein